MGASDLPMFVTDNFKLSFNFVNSFFEEYQNVKILT